MLLPSASVSYSAVPGGEYKTFHQMWLTCANKEKHKQAVPD